MNVLVIEDDIHSLELLRLRLSSLHCEVSVAMSADEGLARIRAQRPDLVVLDLRLAGNLRSSAMDGADLFKVLREDPETADIPVVIHSVYARNPEESPDAMPAADGYLLKPFKFDQLKELVASFQAAKTT